MKSMKSVLALTLLASGALGACEKEDEEDLIPNCRSVQSKVFTCNGFATEDIDPRGCAERGKKIAAADEMCGQLWREAYACVAALECEEFLQWGAKVLQQGADYPCNSEEDAFITHCGEFSLWNDG